MAGICLCAGGPSHELPPPPPITGGDGRGGSRRADSLPPPPQMDGRDGGGGREHRETRQEAAERRERENLRQDRRRERERELRLAEKGKHSRGSALTRDRDRDVSEKIALGQAAVRATEVQYDSRLFNREGGIGSGFRGDDNTAVYDKPLFADRSAMGMYRARDRMDDEVYGGRQGREVDTQRFRPDKGFAGTDAGGVERTGPVQFEKRADEDNEADPFGIDQILSHK
jgi:SNW domain-containing protein 1